MKTFFLCIILTSFFSMSYSQNGTLDHTFGSDGFVAVPTAITGRTMFQPDGKLLAVTTPVNLGEVSVSRFNLDGTPDAGFGNGAGKVTVSITTSEFFQTQGKIFPSIALQANGKIILAFGRFAGLKLIIRLNPDGTLDATFGNNGIVLQDIGRTSTIFEGITNVSVLSDGSIVLLVSLSAGITSGTTVLYSYNPDGSPASGVRFPNLERNQNPFTLTVDRFDKIIFGGHLSSFAVGRRPYLARLNNDLSFDISFGVNGINTAIPGTTIYQLALQPDDKILAFGDLNNILRFNANGFLDVAFGNNGSITSNIALEGRNGGNKQLIIVQEDGKILVGGALNGNFAIERYLPNGTPDASFGNAGVVTTDFGGDERISNMVIIGERLYVYGSGIIAAYLLNNKDVVNCPANINAATDAGTCSKVLSIDPKSVSPTARGVRSDGKPLSDPFLKGSTEIIWYDGSGARICTQSITISDVEAPLITELKPSVSTLEPPDHKMQEVLLSYNGSDNCGTPYYRISISSNESSNGLGDGNTEKDWEILNDHTIRLRRERSGRGDGRIYTITIIGVDASGNESLPVQTTVTVPKGNGNTKMKEQKESARNSIQALEVDGSRREGLHVMVSPNPSTKDFKIKMQQTNSAQQLSVRIFDVAGRVVETRSGVQVDKTITVGSGLKRGIYFAEITGGREKRIVKLIKE